MCKLNLQTTLLKLELCCHFARLLFATMLGSNLLDVATFETTAEEDFVSKDMPKAESKGILAAIRVERRDTFVANDDGTDDFDEDEIIAEEKSNEEDDTASNQMESDKMKEEEFVEKSEEEKIQETLP